MKICHWCKKRFTATIHNCVHLGGHGNVYGCNKCLDLTEE